MQRLGWIGKLKPEMVQTYIDLHANVWLPVLENIKDCHLQNYSIFHRTMATGEHLLFSYMEYTGIDFAADMQRMAANPDVQRWWAECKPCFECIEDLSPGEVWAPMESVFFQA